MYDNKALGIDTSRQPCQRPCFAQSRLQQGGQSHEAMLSVRDLGEACVRRGWRREGEALSAVFELVA